MTAVLRKVRFPLKLKLLTVMIVLIALSLTFFVWIALKIFKEDKSAYIYETLLNKASSEQIILTQKLGEGAFEIIDGALFYNKNNVDQILKNFLEKEETLYDLKIVIPHQTDFYEWKHGQLKKVSQQERGHLAPILSQGINQAVKESEQQNKKWLYAYDYNSNANYAFVVGLSQEKAFAVTSYLINKSTFYGLFILGIAMILSVLLARPLTAQLERLSDLTKDLAQGNFDQRVQLSGHDEVGALSDSINDMADKIVAYMGEMKEKARLENEVAVAQLVQSSFFPQDQINDPIFETHGHFEPATECGGDWWGVADHGDWRILFIADATGHGVPAALLTATMNCCKSSLNFILETRPELVTRPDEILRYMNLAVCGAGKEIQVTCFVAALNRTTRELIYANASHTPPLLYSGATEEVTKESFSPLMEANGPRLGQKNDSLFTLKRHQLNVFDTLIFYTDGLIEADNTEGSRFGERRLLKSLTVHGLGNPSHIIQGIMSDFNEYTINKPKSDDLTIVAMKVIA